MKDKKCSNCKDPIPKGKEAYLNAKVVCDYCFYRLKRKKESSIKEFYRNWIIKPCNDKNYEKN